jgi:sensor histidine kinase YesM
MKLRFALSYTLVWGVFYALYALTLIANRETSLADAHRASFFTVGPAALMGLLVWKSAKVFPWTGTHLSRFFALHAAGAFVYALIWGAVTVAQIAIFTPPFVLELFIQRALGWQLLMGLLLYGVVAGVAYLVQMTERLAEQRVLASKAELQALRAQLNPHFLFNTLHSVTALVGADPAAAEDALVRFGSLLRYALDASRKGNEDVTLEDELAFVRSYLSLEKMRLGERLQVVEDVDPETLDCVLPALTLQPIVENAIQHSVAPRASGGVVHISARFESNSVAIVVRDDGPGSTSDAVNHANGLGLALVKRRLAARFHSQSLAVDTAPGRGFTVTLRIPAESMRVHRDRPAAFTQVPSVRERTTGVPA